MAAHPCTIEGCDGVAHSRGMCPAHYQRWRKHGDPEVFGEVTRYGKPTPDGLCSIEGCQREFYGHGWCATHYARWRRWGDPAITHLDRENAPETCSVDGCEAPHDARGLCGRHFKRLRYGEAPEIALAAGQRRRARKQSNPAFVITDKDWRTLRSSNCLACGSSDRLQLEHLIPLDRGGSHGVGNLAILCHPCNASKRNQTWMEWRTSSKPRALMIFRMGAGALCPSVES